MDFHVFEVYKMKMDNPNGCLNHTLSVWTFGTLIYGICKDLLKVVMRYLKWLVNFNIFLWTFLVIGIFQNFRYFMFTGTHVKTTPDAIEKKNKLKSNNISIKRTSK
eukprot:448138_1